MATAVGDGCGTTVAPRLSLADPVLGSIATLQVRSAASAAFGVIALGFPGYATLPGPCGVHVDLAAPLSLIPFAVPGGTANGSLAVPPAPVLAGLAFALQLFAGPSPQPLGVDLSNAVLVRLGN